MYGVDNVFDLTMKTVKVTHDALISILSNGDIWRWKWQPQDASLKMRYCRKSDLTADVARNWLATQPTREDTAEKLNNSATPRALIRPFYGWRWALNDTTFDRQLCSTWCERNLTFYVSVPRSRRPWWRCILWCQADLWKLLMGFHNLSENTVLLVPFFA